MRNIWNPVDNTVAAIRYIVGRYGTPKAIPGPDWLDEIEARHAHAERTSHVS
ncbi:MAG: hypothetical protein ACYCVB_05630 [Bacilli bacterium]